MGPGAHTGSFRRAPLRIAAGALRDVCLPEARPGGAVPTARYRRGGGHFWRRDVGRAKLARGVRLVVHHQGAVGARLLQASPLCSLGSALAVIRARSAHAVSIAAHSSCQPTPRSVSVELSPSQSRVQRTAQGKLPTVIVMAYSGGGDGGGLSGGEGGEAGGGQTAPSVLAQPEQPGRLRHQGSVQGSVAAGPGPRWCHR